MSERGPKNSVLAFVMRPLVLGSAIIAVALIALGISYNATRGIPLVPTYEVTVDVKDAAELVEGGSEVRIGGARVGLVTGIAAMPSQGVEPPFARLTLNLSNGLDRLPVDSRVAVRNRSLLGAKYLDLIPGNASDTVPDGGRLVVARLEAPVEVDEAISVFDRKTREAVQGTLIGLGDGLAGRGESLNRSLLALSRAVGPLQRLLAVIVKPETDLNGFISGAHALTTALDPVAPTLGSLFDAGATTLEALDAAGETLPRTISELPPTEAEATRALVALNPVLADATAIARQIRSGTALLPDASEAFSLALQAAHPVLLETPELAGKFNDTLVASEELLRNPNSASLFSELTTTVDSLNNSLAYLTPAQVQCNVGGLYVRNVSSTVSGGDQFGSWLNVVILLDTQQILQSAKQAPNLHVNPLPIENGQECESGNEPWERGQLIGNPDGLQQNSTELTEPPPGVTDLAAGVGLVP